MRLAVTTALVLLLAGCSRETAKSASTESAPTNTAVTSAAPLQQDVQLIEYEIRMPDTLRAGHLSFHVANAGKENHGLVIEGEGIRQEAPAMSRGDIATLDVDLKPGTYTVYCPVPGHKERGMSRTITVR